MSQTEPRFADFLSNKRASNLFTTVVNEPIGAFFALQAYRAGLAPTALTLINLVIGLATGVTIILVAGSAADGDVTWWPIALAAAVAWQVSYSLDCSDGQLARTTGRSSPMGARVDILCDVASQATFCAAVVAVVQAYSPAVPAWFMAAFASLWMVNLVTSILQKGEQAASMVTSKNLAVELVKLVRDTGVIVLLMPLILIVYPEGMVWFMALFTVVNGLFLFASIAFAARDALRS